MRGMLYSVNACSPVISGPVILELKGADAVSYSLDCIRDRVCEIVHRVDAPFVPGSWMGGELDPVKGRVPHVDIGTCHIYLGPERIGALRMLSFLHLLE